MRRQVSKRNKQKAAPAPAPAVPTTAVAKPEPAQEAMPPVLAASMEELMALFSYTPPDKPLVSSGDALRVPCVRFFSGSEGKQGGALSVAGITSQLGNVQPGTPYLLHEDGSTVSPLAGSTCVQLAEYQYWGCWDSSNNLLGAWTSPPGTKEVDGKRVTEAVMAVQVFLPGSSPLAEHLQPAQVAFSTFRGAQSKPPVTMQRAIEQATDPKSDWIRRNPQLAKLPDRMRVTGTLQAQIKTSKAGFNYCLASVFTTPIGAPQMQALAAWWEDADCQAEKEEALAAFADEVATIEAQASA